MTADSSLLRLVAELYYVRDWNEQSIARLLGFSRSKVSRLLTTARSEGIVQITLTPETSVLDPLSAEVAGSLGIPVRLTPGRAVDSASAGRLCAVAAAPLIAADLPQEGVVGVAGGYTVSALVDALAPMSRPGVTVVPIVGSYYVQDSNLDVNAVASALGRHLGASSRRILAPGLLDSLDTKMALLQDSAVRATTELWQQLDLVVLGVSGSPTDRPGYATVMDQLDAGGRARLHAKGVVGEVAGHLLSADGTLVEDEWTSRALSIPVELVRDCRRVVAIAVGEAKVPAIVASVKAGLVKLLYTDESTARAILARTVPSRAG